MDELTELALKARDGNRLSLGSLIRKSQADVWRVCNHLGPRGQADDLTQDVFVKMMRSLPNFRGESSARTWILAIARHVAIDAVRARQRSVRNRLKWTREDLVHLPDHSADFDDVMGALDPDQHAAFVLTQLLGLSYAEAAVVCRCPIGTVRSRVARARSTLVAAVVGEDLLEVDLPI